MEGSVKDLNTLVAELELEFDKLPIDYAYSFKGTKVVVFRTGRTSGYGINGIGNWEASSSWNFLEFPHRWEPLTKQEWMEVLRKRADSLYKDVHQIDRSDLSLPSWSFGDITYLQPSPPDKSNTDLDEDGYQYRGIYVMDKFGVWATPIK